jgi:NAD(P)-dependent dehydrogenase (short-subunit alcohol dehydrogenase family)
MSFLENRVAIVTGGARGVGRSYALKLAEHGAKVLVNDLGATATGEGADLSPAQEVVDIIRSNGGEAAVNGADVANFDQAGTMIEQAVDTFGRLDILINNAGILRDRMMVNMSEDEWDSVIRVHLKGTFAPTHHAANHWRLKSKAGEAVDARVINTTSHSGLFANIGQANYAAAKAGIAAFSIVTARELQRIGVTVNAIAPRANTRMTEGLREWTPEQLDKRDPEWIAGFVAWLSSTESHYVSGRVFEVWGNGITVAESWQHGPTTEASKDPTTLGEGMKSILTYARANAGIDLNTWSNP